MKVVVGVVIVGVMVVMMMMSEVSSDVRCNGPDVGRMGVVDGER